MSLEECFSQIADPRKSSGLRHPLVPFLCMLTMSYMSGYTGYRSSSAFMKGNVEAFTQMFGLKHGTPGHTQIKSIISVLDFKQINTMFFKWISQFVSIEPDEWICGDGKGLNSTLSNAHNAKQDYEFMVRLFSQKLGLVLQTHRARNKQGEIKALQDLLKKLKHKGVIITLDAVHCQKKQ